jgi:hypothetical protein
MKAFCLALAIAAAFAMTSPAIAGEIHVVNTTDSCAFVSASYSTGAGFGHLIGSKWLHPHDAIAFGMPYAQSIRVNAEVHAHGKCGGQGLYHTYDEKAPGSASAMTFELMPGNGREWLWFTKFGTP